MGAVRQERLASGDHPLYTTRHPYPVINNQSQMVTDTSSPHFGTCRNTLLPSCARTHVKTAATTSLLSVKARLAAERGKARSSVTGPVTRDNYNSRASKNQVWNSCEVHNQTEEEKEEEKEGDTLPEELRLPNSKPKARFYNFCELDEGESPEPSVHEDDLEDILGEDKLFP